MFANHNYYIYPVFPYVYHVYYPLFVLYCIIYQGYDVLNILLIAFILSHVYCNHTIVYCYCILLIKTAYLKITC